MINSKQEKYQAESGHTFTLRKYHNVDNPLERDDIRVKVLFTSKTLEKYSTITHIRNIDSGTAITDEDMVNKFKHKFGNIALAEKVVSVCGSNGKVKICLDKTASNDSALKKDVIGWIVLPTICESSTDGVDANEIGMEMDVELAYFCDWLNGDCWEFEVVTPPAVVPIIERTGYVFGNEEEVAQYVNDMIEDDTNSSSFEEGIVEVLLRLAHKAHITDKFFVADKLRILAHDIEAFQPCDVADEDPTQSEVTQDVVSEPSEETVSTVVEPTEEELQKIEQGVEETL